MSDYLAWWDGLSLLLKFYWAIAIPFTVFFLLQLILTFFGGDFEHSPDDADFSESGGLQQYLTLKNMIAFFTIFAWAGIATTESGLSLVASILISVACGTVMVIVMVFLMVFLSKAQADGTMKFAKAVGQIGNVYLTIPAKRANSGQVQVNVQGVLRTLDAVTDDETDLASGKVVVVREVLSDNLLLVSGKSN